MNRSASRVPPAITIDFAASSTIITSPAASCGAGAGDEDFELVEFGLVNPFGHAEQRCRGARRGAAEENPNKLLHRGLARLTVGHDRVVDIAFRAVGAANEALVLEPAEHRPDGGAAGSPI